MQSTFKEIDTMKKFSVAHMFARWLCCYALVAVVATPCVSALAQEAPRVKITTNVGEIIVELYPDRAPKTVDNFMEYVKSGHYVGTLFHRVINGFMIQGGGFDRSMIEKPTRAPIPLEANNGLRNDRGTLAMARTAAPNSATAQFFINLVDNSTLNAPNPDGYGYAVFGRVVSGMDVVDRIGSASTTKFGALADVPVQPIVITSVVPNPTVPAQESSHPVTSKEAADQRSGKAPRIKNDMTGDSFPAVPPKRP